MGLTSVIGDESAGWAAGECIQEHADGEREQPLHDSLHQSGGCFRECCSSRIWHLRLEIVDSITSLRLARRFSRSRLQAVLTRSGVWIVTSCRASISA